MTQYTAGHAVEYRDIEGQPSSVVTIIEERTKPDDLSRTYQLYSRTAGWKPAGSMAIWADASWGVRFMLDGATHGRSFKDEKSARELFDLWTRPEA